MQLDHGAADLGEFAAVGGDLHALDHGGAAGAGHAALPGDLHDAQAAGGGGLQVVVLAERRDLHLHLAGGLRMVVPAGTATGRPLIRRLTGAAGGSAGR